MVLDSNTFHKVFLVLAYLRVRSVFRFAYQIFESDWACIKRIYDPKTLSISEVHFS